MRTVVQRVSSASVSIEGRTVGAIDRGLLVLLGIAAGDVEGDGQWLADKLAALRIFPDDQGRMNRSVREIGGQVLVISQFTLFASTRKGTRPSFNDAASPETARALYQHFLQQLEAVLEQPVARGEFGADMDVALVNAGPVTLVIDSKLRE
jgi:D-tyrosyl-tRNA(Tyr) deacylase